MEIVIDLNSFWVGFVSGWLSIFALGVFFAIREQRKIANGKKNRARGFRTD